jgi:hypothetical protein
LISSVILCLSSVILCLSSVILCLSSVILCLSSVFSVVGLVFMDYPQQPLPPGARIFFSLNHSLMSPLAHPTPESTWIAATGQLPAQAPHSMQASISARRASFPSSANT